MSHQKHEQVSGCRPVLVGPTELVGSGFRAVMPALDKGEEEERIACASPFEKVTLLECGGLAPLLDAVWQGGVSIFQRGATPPHSKRVESDYRAASYFSETTSCWNPGGSG